MFGIFYTFLLIVSGIKDSINNECYKEKSKQTAIKNNKDTYYDMFGNEYYKDRKALTIFNYKCDNGETHKVITDVKTGEVIKDYTQELINDFFIKRNKIIEEAKKNNRLYYIIKPNNNLIQSKQIYEKSIKGYCGAFETQTGRRYLLSSEIKKYNDGITWVYYKYYYKRRDSENELDDLYYTKDKPIIITKEEYFQWGGLEAESKNYNFIPKGGII